jgi:hypothetical protein
VSGYQAWQGAQLHADLIYRPASGADQTLASVDSTPSLPPDGGFPMGAIDTDVQVAAVAARCGDLLIFRVTLEASAMSFIELETGLSIP